MNTQKNTRSIGSIV